MKALRLSSLLDIDFFQIRWPCVQSMFSQYTLRLPPLVVESPSILPWRVLVPHSLLKKLLMYGVNLLDFHLSSVANKQWPLVPEAIEKKGLFTLGSEVLYLRVKITMEDNGWWLSLVVLGTNTEIMAPDLRCRVVFWTRGCEDTFWWLAFPLVYLSWSRNSSSSMKQLLRLPCSISFWLRNTTSLA